MILARADCELRALVAELRDDAAVAKCLGIELDGLIEAAEERTERLFWTVSDPHQYPGASTRGALAGAWFHGALCAGVELAIRDVKDQALAHFPCWGRL